MFPNSLALTNCPQTLQQTFDIKCQPPQAITIETLHNPHKHPQSHKNTNKQQQQQQQQQQQPCLNTEFVNRMLAMKLLARNRIANYSRQEMLSTAREPAALNPVSDVRREEAHKGAVGQSGPNLQKKTENKENSKARTEIIRLKNILEEQHSQLELIIDPSKAKKSTMQAKKLSLSQQTEEKELSLKINRIISSLTREVSSLERQISRVTCTTGHTNELGQKLLSTYQFSMSFIQTYHNEYQSRLTESTQNNFKEKLSKLTKSLANCVTQLSEFPNFDFPMPELAPKPVGTKQKKSKVQNQKNPNLQKRSLKNAHPRLPQYIEHKPIEPSRHYIRKPQLEGHHNLSSDESLISLLASKPDHFQLSPSNSRIQSETIPPRQTGRYISKPAKLAIIRDIDFNPLLNGLAQETIEELIDEQISHVINSINLSEVISRVPLVQNAQSLPELIEDLDYYLSAIDSYQSVVRSVEKNLASLDDPIEHKPRAQDTTIEREDSRQCQEDRMIVIPRPDQLGPDIHTEPDTSSPTDKDTNIPSINPVFIQNLADDKYKMMRHNRLHQPSIKFALRHNLLESLKDEILSSRMDSVSEQIFQTLDSYVEKNFFDEFLKTPETMNLVQNIMRRATEGANLQTIGTSTQLIQTERQIRSVLSSPTDTNSTVLSQAYSSDFQTDKSISESTLLSEHSYSPTIQYESLGDPTQTECSENIPTQLEQYTSVYSNTEEGEVTVLASNVTDGLSMVEETVEMLSPSLQSPLPGILSPLALTPVRETPAAEAAEQKLPTPEHSRDDTTFSPFLDTDYSSDGGPNLAGTARVPLPSPHLSPLTSKEASLSELAYDSVLRKRSDIVCLDIDDMLILHDGIDPPTYSLSASGEYDQPSRLKRGLEEYNSTFTQSNSTLYSVSQPQLEMETGSPVPPRTPQTPIFQDSLDNTQTHSSSRGTPVTPTDSIEEDISVSLSN